MLNCGKEALKPPTGQVPVLDLSQPRQSNGMRMTLSVAAALSPRAWRVVRPGRNPARQVVVSAARCPWGAHGIIMEAHYNIIEALGAWVM